MSDLVWMPEKPTVEGWYFVRWASGDFTIARVVHSKWSREWYAKVDGGEYSLKSFSAFAGPIQEPES